MNGKPTREVGMVFSGVILGTMIYANGDRYTGEWKNDQRNGKGTQQDKELGKQTCADGSHYAGDWKDDKKNGTGRLAVQC